MDARHDAGDAEPEACAIMDIVHGDCLNASWSGCRFIML
jgi:hypothetical protein